MAAHGWFRKIRLHFVFEDHLFSAKNQMIVLIITVDPVDTADVEDDSNLQIVFSGIGCVDIDVVVALVEIDPKNCLVTQLSLKMVPFNQICSFYYPSTG